MPTFRELIQEGRVALQSAGIQQPARESGRLVAHALGIDEAQVLARDLETAPSESTERIRRLLGRRATGEPLAYLTGEREFFGRSFSVDRRVLIPRPETEHLVEIALELPLPARARVLDVGTGSGCLAVSIAAERPDWTVVATDVSIAALAVARGNAHRHGVADRVLPLAADLARGLELGPFDLVVGNPPYVEAGVVPYLSRDVRDFEPRVALVGGADGLGTVRALLGQLAALRAGTWVALEFGLGQEDAVVEVATGHGCFELVELRRDLAGIERDVVFRIGHGPVQDSRTDTTRR